MPWTDGSLSWSNWSLSWSHWGVGVRVDPGVVWTSWDPAWYDWTRSIRKLQAEFTELLRTSDGAHFRRGAIGPASSTVTAALHFGQQLRVLIGTTAIQHTGKAEPSTSIQTPGTVRGGVEALRTFAEVAADSVGAFTQTAESRDVRALIQVVTFLGDFVELVTCGAFTFKGAHGVDAVSTLTNAWDGLALVHILAGPSAVVRDEPSPTGVRLSGAHLAGMTPGSSHRGTAQSLSAHDARQLALAHLVIHRGEAWACAVISLTLCSCEAVGADAAVRRHTSSSVQTAVLTHRLTTVVSYVAFLTHAAVLGTRPSVHTANVAVLDRLGATGWGDLAVGAGAHVWSGAEAVAAGAPTDRDNALVSSGQSLPSRTAVSITPGATHVWTSENV